jgi:cytochrome c oxidase assembly protein subunit 15
MSLVVDAATALVDLGPAVEMAMVGAGLSLLPVLWVALRLRRHKSGGWRAWQRALTLVTLFLTIDLVAFGAFTRLTDSGLGCPDWPGCYGSTSPVGAHGEIAQAQAASPTGPVTHRKAWIEMIHRYLATGVGVLITGLMLASWWARWRGGHAATGGLSPWWPTWTWIWVCAQGAFGALTVTLKLFPLIVTGHLLGGLLGVALLTAQARAISPLAPGAAPLAARLQLGAAIVLAVWFAQAALGGWVSTNGAVLACAEVPMCQGQWWPAMDWARGFTLWRGLGEDGAGGSITLAALTAIHVTHRLGAVVATLAVLWLAWRLRPVARREANVLLGLLGAQLLSGLSNVVLGWPLLAALAHTLGAALMAGWLTWLAVLPRVDTMSRTLAAPSPASRPALT